jgi:hypothetical protein
MPAIKRNFILPTGIGISAETLFVNSSIGSTTTSTGSIVSYGGAGIAGSLSLGGRLQLFNSSNYTAFISSASGNTTYTLPATSPATGSSVLQSTSAGVMSWVPMVASSSGTTSNNVNVTLAATNASHPILFTPATSTVTGAAVSSETSFVYNPSTDILSVSGLAVTSGLASTTFNTGALVVTGGVGIGGSLTINGDLTVNGTTTTINSVTLTVDDKNIELGSVNSPSDITAEAGGITLKGATDKFINWYTGTGWSSNESLNLASGLVYKIANTSVLSASSIGTGITNSSLTALGTITTGTWAGSTITARYGGTGITSYTVGDVLYANTTSTLARITAGTAGSVLASAGAGATPYYADPNVLVTSSSGTTSRNVNVTSASTNSTHYLAFTPASSTVAGAALSSGSAITANPNTGTISATTFTGTTGSFTTVNAQGSTASTYFGNGALVVSGGAGISGQLSFNSAALGYTGASNPSMAFIGSTNVAPITLTATSDGAILFEGSSGKLFGINNNLSSGWIFNVGDISGLPIIRANADGTIAMAEFMANVGIGLSNPQYKLHVTGSVGFTSSTASISPTSGALLVTGGVGIGGSLYVASATGISGVSINAGVITGSLTGNVTGFASTGRNVDVQLATTNATHAVTFTPALSAVTGSATSSDGTLVYNPSSKILTTSGLAVTSSTASVNTSTGALIVTGGVGIGGSVYANSLAVDTGLFGLSLQRAAAGSLGAIYSTGVTPSSSNYSFATDGTNLNLNSTSNIYFNISNNNRLTLTANNLSVGINVASTSTSSGALTVTGGVGIGGSLYVGGVSSISSVILNSGVITGSLTGTATTATNVNVAFTSTGSTVYPVFTGAASTTTGTGLSSNSSLSYVPSTGTLTASTFSGSLTGNVTGFASTGRNVNTVAAGSSNIAHLLLFSTASGTVSGAAISNDTTFSFNPSTEILSVSGVAVTAGTASTNSATGALRVSGGLGVSGQLSFNTASLGSTGYSNPSIIFSGSAGSAPITLTVQSDNTLSWEGTSGQLFAIDNNLTTGDIFSVSDISGLPIINASAGQTVSINEFGGFTRIGNGTISSTGASNANADGSLVVYGGVGITGNANIGGTVRITNTTASTGNTSGALVVSGGAGIGQSLFVGGNLNLTGTFYSGTNTFTKNLGLGDISLDNGTSDTPSITFYWGNNKNLGIDAYWAGSGVTRFRITKELNETGGGELWSVDRNGIVTQTAWDVGEVINTRVYNNTDLSMSATTTINSTTYTNVATITYTPKSTTSYLWIEFDAHYDYSNGTTTDDFFSRITVGGSAIVEKNQIMVGQIGGGTRSGTIFPISGRYTNSTTSGIAITVQARWGSADDNIRVYGSSTSGYMRIQEIGR